MSYLDAILNIQEGYTLVQTILMPWCIRWFRLALVLISGIREQFEVIDIPEVLKGFPIALITVVYVHCIFRFNGLV